MASAYVNAHGLVVHAITARRTRDSKIAHLFLDFVNGGVSGTPHAFCDRRYRDERAVPRAWTNADNLLPLCKRCARVFNAAQSKVNWAGEP